jgi:hypothetical protein
MLRRAHQERLAIFLFVVRAAHEAGNPLPLSKTAPGLLSLNGPLLGKKKMVLSSK